MSPAALSIDNGIVRPHALLCAIRHPELPYGYGDAILQAFFKEVLSTTPQASFELRVGDILIHNISYRLHEVSSETSARTRTPTTSRTYTDDKTLRITLVWDFVDAAAAKHSTLDKNAAAIAMLSHRIFCLTVSALSDAERQLLDPKLRSYPWYLGLFEIDLGNPLLRSLAADGLIPICRYEAQTVSTFIRPGSTAEDTGSPFPTGDLSFNNVHVVEADSLLFPEVSVSERGLISKGLLHSRAVPKHQEQVAKSLVANFENSHATDSLKFTAAGESLPILEDKLKQYVLNEAHPVGGHKAKLFRQLLAIGGEHWAFLAEQLIAGLDPAEIERARQSDHGVQYHCDVPVIGRNGAAKVVRTAWIIAPTSPPRLTTAYILDDPADTKGIAKTKSAISDKPLGSARWADIYDRAHAAGIEAAERYIPTPMIFSDHSVEPGGACGSGIIELTDGRSAFARWLRKNGITFNGRRGARIFYSHESQSVEKAGQYAEAFASVLRLNGIDCSARTLLD